MISPEEATFRGTSPDSNNYRGALCLNMKTRGVGNRWRSVISWMFLIFVGSTDVLSAEQTSRFLVPSLLWLDPQISVATITTIHVALRKLGHLTEYTILAALLWYALRGTLTSMRTIAISGLVFLRLRFLPHRTNFINRSFHRELLR